MEPSGDQEFDFLYKVALVGEAEVGKSALMLCYKDGTIPKDYRPTIGVEFTTKIVKLPVGGTVKAQIWDTAGQERYRSFTLSYYREVVGALIVYDITQMNTFQNIERWVGEVRSMAEPGAVIVLVGNKADLVESHPERREVNADIAREMADRNGLLFMETSVMDGQKVEAVFLALLSEINKKQRVGGTN